MFLYMYVSWVFLIVTVIGYNINVVDIFTCRCSCDVIITSVTSGLSSRDIYTVTVFIKLYCDFIVSNIIF